VRLAGRWLEPARHHADHDKGLKLFSFVRDVVKDISGADLSL
jgi:hypothetical protein